MRKCIIFNFTVLQASITNCTSALNNAKLFSGVSLWEYVQQNFSSKVSSLQDLDNELDACLETNSCDISDNESEFSYADLINDYTSNKTKLGPDQETLNMDSDSKSPESLDENTASNRRDLERVDSSDLSENSKKIEWDFEEFDGVAVPKKYVVKWAAQLLLAVEKLHSLGVICWYVGCTRCKYDFYNNFFIVI